MVAAVVGDRALQLREADPTAGSTEGQLLDLLVGRERVVFDAFGEKGCGLVFERQPEAPCALHDPPGQHGRTPRPRLDHVSSARYHADCRALASSPAAVISTTSPVGGRSAQA
jgi:hypothetical protein